MIYLKDDKTILRELASIKWQDISKCKKCKYHLFYEGATPYSRKCKRCKYDESITANTLLAGQKMPISKMISILLAIRTRYMEILYEQVPITKEHWGRLSTTEIAHRFGVRQKTVSDFLNRIMSRLPKSFYKKTDVPDFWLYGVHPDNWKRYFALYNFLIESDDEQEIFEILIYGKKRKITYIYL